MKTEAARLAENPSPHDPWRAWGPYVSARQWGTVGVSENIIEASWQALVDGIDYKLLIEEEKDR